MIFSSFLVMLDGKYHKTVISRYVMKYVNFESPGSFQEMLALYKYVDKILRVKLMFRQMNILFAMFNCVFARINE